MNIGGKAQSLQKLQDAGFNVPPFFVCDGSWDEERILQTLDEILPGTNYFAVRSSASGEDGDNKSYAGHFYSAVAVTKGDMFKEVQRVLSSFGDLDGSVIIQEFVPSDVSGIAFSDNSEGVVVINSNFGLCKNVVEGKACDEYLTQKDGTLIRKSISTEKLVLSFRDGNLKEQVNRDESLTTDQLKQVVELAKRSENYFKKPQDIEWCFRGQTLYILQSRPITRKLVAHGEEEYFDSANIAESYSGIVLPLTCSFASRVYQQVYTDFLRMSGVPVRQLKAHSYVFENLLGFFHGRMYYNMNNWYRLAQFVPGYKRNKENFELMITSNVKKEIASTISPSWILKTFYPLIVLAKVAVFNITSWRFKTHVQKSIKQLRKNDFSSLSFEECTKMFSFLENDLLRRWYVTLENDFFVMTYLGALQKFIPDEKLQDVLAFESKATEQVTALVELSREMQKNNALWTSVKDRDVAVFQKEIIKYPHTKGLFDAYLELFGGRFANELKLETIGMDEDISKFLNVVDAYATYKSTPGKHHPHTEVELSFLKGVVYKIALHTFKKYASQREEFRLLRSNMFAITRSIFKRVGHILVDKKKLKHADDIFYLTVEEVLGVGRGTGQESQNFIEVVEKRKIEYETYAYEHPPAHFVTSDGSVPIASKEVDGVSLIQARGVSSGVVRGRIKIMKEFSMPEKIDFEILVTKHTDPGWTALIALSKGIIIEHGGVLSHASIVARELGIPAVIGVRGATDMYTDGQIVELNGSDGTIKIE